MYLVFGKRLFDIIMVILLLIFLSPIILVLVVTLLIQFGKDFIYKQSRHTMGLEEFTIYKFRTMYDKYDLDNKLLPDSQRVTKLGRFLRVSSLDEIPSLINVLRGDMSIIGPRPLPVRYSNLMTPMQLKRYNVKSGLTGLAQTLGRNSVPWETRMKLDQLYVKRISFWSDLLILLKTTRVLLSPSRIENLDYESFENYKPNLNERTDTQGNS